MSADKRTMDKGKHVRSKSALKMEEGMEQGKEVYSQDQSPLGLKTEISENALTNNKN